jgi:hypothetical protein
MAYVFDACRTGRLPANSCVVISNNERGPRPSPMQWYSGPEPYQPSRVPIRRVNWAPAS